MNTITTFNVNNEMELTQRQWENEYQKNLSYWSKFRNNEIKVNETLIDELLNNNNQFYIKLENDSPYKKDGQVMISLSFMFIGTNSYYGYVSKDYYDKLVNNIQVA